MMRLNEKPAPPARCERRRDGIHSAATRCGAVRASSATISGSGPKWVTMRLMTWSSPTVSMTLSTARHLLRARGLRLRLTRGGKTLCPTFGQAPAMVLVDIGEFQFAAG
jgi:hypothetical protein